MKNDSMDDNEFKQKLNPEQYRVMREGGTEVPFSGEHVKPGKEGVFKCAACGQELFSSEHQYESTTPGLVGWPSFSKAVNDGAIKLAEDKSLGTTRTEVKCANCGSHLGHVFDEESSDSGKHYCINSVCLDFDSEDKS